MIRRAGPPWAICWALVLLGACDRSPTATPVRLPVKNVAEFKPIAQIAPNRTAHVTLDPLGNVYWSQETDRGDDVVFAIGRDAIPRATQLSSANILAAMGETLGGNGTIQGLAGGLDGHIYFYFIGGKGKTMRACLGRLIPRTGAIHVLADTKALADATGMGRSLELARATMLCSERRLWLLLRHTDAWVIFRVELGQILGDGQITLRPAFRQVTADGQALDLTRERYELSLGPGETLLLTDRTDGVLWQVDPLGRAKLRAMLVGLPRELSAPAVVKQDHLMFFAGDSEPIEAQVDEPMLRRLPAAAYPALLELSGHEFTAIGRDDLRVSGGVPAYAMRLGRLVPAPDGSWVAYDSSSGQLLRITLAAQQ